MQDGKNYGAADTPRFASHDVLATASRRALGGSREHSSSSQRAALPSCEVKNYEDFLKTKQKRASFKSIEISRDELNGALFDYQKDLVYLALKKGHFAIFAMTGSGKTAMQGEWAYQIWLKERAPVLIVTPLAVAFQSIEEIKHILGYDVKFCESADDVINGLNITNYEKLDKFDPDAFVALVLDES